MSSEKKFGAHRPARQLVDDPEEAAGGKLKISLTKLILQIGLLPNWFTLKLVYARLSLSKLGDSAPVSLHCLFSAQTR